MADMNERVKPLRLTDPDTGKTYELDFSKESILFAERSDFSIEDVQKYLLLKTPELFYYSFRMHHRNMARNQTDAIIKKLGGLRMEWITRLAELYIQAFKSNDVVVFPDDDGNYEEKNSGWVVEMD